MITFMCLIVMVAANNYDAIDHTGAFFIGRIKTN